MLDESALMSGQFVDDVSTSSPTSMTVDELVDAVSASVVDSLSGRLDALEGRLDFVAGRAQLDGLSERVAALSGTAATKADLEQATEQAVLQAGELGPVLDDEIGALLIGLVDLLDSDGDGASDIASLVSDIQTSVQDVAGALSHPAMSTPFSDFTVLEALFLLSILFAFVKLWLVLLERGFSWLR